ncbi:hypothetical protein N802_16535 [Knoellia sinensis KCTC 19936]|uniref:Uncharacterized protein n=1 Tax=Knoellia sinensis KCTC 19936 TaxID=1385520 RepID=A0A0A0J6M0_9MICO|nr:hypothetical protein N802_16535 [Knoellia sinensis KCTC 19936]
MCEWLGGLTPPRPDELQDLLVNPRLVRLRPQPHGQESVCRWPATFAPCLAS